MTLSGGKITTEVDLTKEITSGEDYSMPTLKQHLEVVGILVMTYLKGVLEVAISLRESLLSLNGTIDLSTTL